VICISAGKEEVQDTTKAGFSQGKSNKNPQSILSGYKYDPITDRYIYTNQVDGFSIIILLSSLHRI
jgi:hypothetical protein